MFLEKPHIFGNKQTQTWQHKNDKDDDDENSNNVDATDETVTINKTIEVALQKDANK